MTTKVQKWGNSLAVRLPKELADKMDLKSGTAVRFVRKGANVEMQPIAASKPKKYSLEELVAQITPENKHDVFDWGKPMGKEIW
jgi:antitoxin MazE